MCIAMVYTPLVVGTPLYWDTGRSRSKRSRREEREKKKVCNRVGERNKTFPSTIGNCTGKRRTQGYVTQEKEKEGLWHMGN